MMTVQMMPTVATNCVAEHGPGRTEQDPKAFVRLGIQRQYAARIGYRISSLLTRTGAAGE